MLGCKENVNLQVNELYSNQTYSLGLGEIEPEIWRKKKKMVQGTNNSASAKGLIFKHMSFIAVLKKY